MHCDLSGRAAWISGGTEGIGLAIARGMAEAGARVALCGHLPDKAEEAAETLRSEGHEAVAAPCDVAESAAVKASVAAAVEAFGRLDIAVANAGINGTWAPVEDITEDEWRRTIDVNLTGTFHAAKHAAPHLKKGGGSFLIVASVNGTRVFSNTGASAYASSKAAQLAFGKMLALEWAKWKVRVNVICPGAVDTGIHDKTERRGLDEIRTPVEFPEGNMPAIDDLMGDPAKVASLAVFLASDHASLITGTPVWVDAAESLLQG